MENENFSFKIKVLRAYYISNGLEYLVSIPYYHFTQDGNVALDGQDEVGRFSFSGKASGDYIYLEKKYHGKHTVYYAGKLDGAHLHLHYDFQGDYDNLITKIKSGDYNGGVVFDAQLYNLHFDGKVIPVFLAVDEDDAKLKLKGLGIIDNKAYKLVLEKSSSDLGKLKLKQGDDERTLNIRISGYDLYVDGRWTYSF